MTNNEFRCWIKGFYELADDRVLNQSQRKMLQNHADLVKKTTGRLEQDIVLFLQQLDIHQNAPSVIIDLLPHFCNNSL